MKALFYIWLEEYWSASLIFHKLHSPFLMFFRTKLMSEVLLKQQIKLFRISFKSSFCFIDVRKTVSRLSVANWSPCVSKSADHLGE